MKLKYDSEGAVGGKLLVVSVVALVAVLLYSSGMLQFTLPGVGGNEYEETVVRTVAHCGMKIPISVTLTFDQDAKTGYNRAYIDCYAKHKQTKSGQNYCPNPELVLKTSYNAQVGNINDKSTIYAVNGNGFIAGNTTFDVPVEGINGVFFEPAQHEIKMWNQNPGDMHTPNIGEGNHCILIQISVIHYQRGTQTVLDSSVVNVNIFYKLPEYNANSEFQKNYRFYIYVPFTKFALAEDIKLEVRAYEEHCVVVWREIISTKRVWWEWKIYLSFWPPGISIKNVKQVESTTEMNLKYEWQSPRALPIGQNQYGSHSYTYKVR